MTTACRGRRTPPTMNQPNLGMLRTGATPSSGVYTEHHDRHVHSTK